MSVAIRICAVPREMLTDDEEYQHEEVEFSEDVWDEIAIALVSVVNIHERRIIGNVECSALIAEAYRKSPSVNADLRRELVKFVQICESGLLGQGLLVWHLD